MTFKGMIVSIFLEFEQKKLYILVLVLQIYFVKMGYSIWNPAHFPFGRVTESLKYYSKN